MIEIIAMVAMEVCSTKASFDDCMDWYGQCMIQQVENGSQDLPEIERAMEFCNKNIPLDFEGSHG